MQKICYKKILFFIFLIFPLVAWSQSLSHYSFNSASGFFSNNLTLDYSFGQLIIDDFSNKKVITSGFVQYYKVKEDLPKNSLNNLEANIAIYPNPVGELLNVNIVLSDEIENISIEIFDVNGKNLPVKFDKNIYGKQAAVYANTSALITGNYNIRIIINQKIIKNITITKI